jgi:multiple sugar transport system ATP-binding protein
MGCEVARVRFEGVGKVYEDGTRALTDLNLDVKDGEFLIIVGPSGCGKTTAMRLVAGLEAITEGKVWIGERVVNQLAPKARNIAMVFQNYALYPQMSVFGNIAFPWRMEKRSKPDIKAGVERVGRTLGLEDLLNRRPGRLSGGERQRVAMGRAIIRDPQVFLMDEPLSNLDARLRVQMRAEVLRIHGELGVTTIYVTHDQVEAMTMGDRVAVMRNGVLQQLDRGQTLYDRPGNLFVATFIGSPEMNVVLGAMEGDSLHLAGQEVKLPPELLARYAGLEAYRGRVVAVGIRPEWIECSGQESFAGVKPRLMVRGDVRLVESLGPECLVHVTVPVLQDETKGAFAGVKGGALSDYGSGRTNGMLVARTSANLGFGMGDVIDLGIGLDKLHLFDIESGEALVRR